MKKSILLFATLLIVFAGFAQNKIANTSPICQEPTNDRGIQELPWAEMQMWTATDINGNEHNLTEYLAAGKTVFVDFSATWCPPCWSFHQSGVLKNLHNQYGPAGTDEIVVLWFEIDGATIDQIHGIGSNTQGDWTENDTYPVPIIQASSQLKSYFYDLYTGYIPEMFMICPTGYYTVLEAKTNVSYYMSQIGTCPATGKVPMADIIGNTTAFLGSPISFQADVVSIDPITAYEWTFENGNPATSDQANVSVTWDTVGEHTISLKVYNANGASNIAEKTVNVIDVGNVDDLFVTFEEIIVEGTFPKVFAPYNWTTVDVDGGTVWGNFADYGVTGATNAFSCYSHDLAASADFAPYEGDKCGFAMTNNSSSGPYNNDWFISPQISLGINSSFSVYLRSVKTTWGLEKYKIAISTTDNNPASFTVLGSVAEAPGSWTQVTKDLSDYDNQQIYIAINYVGEDKFAFAIDNLKITTTDTDVEDVIIANTQVFPNPANDVININYVEGAKIQIFNNIGQEVYSMANANEYNQIDMSAHQAGTYVVRITKGDKTNNYKMILVK
ncbi:MAG TPA: choice-of-anchor J domain-containing protein [Bacteroidales bacterium]|nr:choice-of-anchor J domain-containing protein [Bacteroidales bacterium]